MAVTSILFDLPQRIYLSNFFGSSRQGKAPPSPLIFDYFAPNFNHNKNRSHIYLAKRKFKWVPHTYVNISDPKVFAVISSNSFGICGNHKKSLYEAAKSLILLIAGVGFEPNFRL